MTQGSTCPNFNHRRLNVLVRFCTMCGEVVNKDILAGKSNDEEHPRKRRQRNKNCVD